jgi:hypothetical protein
VQRFVAAAASGDQRDFFGGRRAPKYEFALRPERDDRGVRGDETVETLRQDGID